jgi:outer membrane protein assembly factor BamB
MPIFSSKMVIINDNFAALHCFNAKTGVVVRRIDLRSMHYVVDPDKNFWTVDKNIFYFLGKDETNTEEMIYALDLSRGRVSWKKALGKQEKVKIRLAGQYFFVTLQNKLLILNKKNGNELKNIEMPYEFEISEILKDIVIVCPIGQTVAPEEYAVALRWK